MVINSNTNSISTAIKRLVMKITERKNHQTEKLP